MSATWGHPLAWLGLVSKPRMPFSPVILLSNSAHPPTPQEEGFPHILLGAVFTAIHRRVPCPFKGCFEDSFMGLPLPTRWNSQRPCLNQLQILLHHPAWSLKPEWVLTEHLRNGGKG